MQYFIAPPLLGNQTITTPITPIKPIPPP